MMAGGERVRSDLFKKYCSDIRMERLRYTTMNVKMLSWHVYGGRNREKSAIFL
jgi:hypothetical protein